MGLDTGISWTHSTFNPWRGCQRVSPGCEHCYAETLSKRNRSLLGQWGPPASGGTRVIASPAMWREPLKWNAHAKVHQQQHRVFCSSLADVFEDLRELDLPRAWLWELIHATPHLTWLLLTKRPQNVLSMVPARWMMEGPGMRTGPRLRREDLWPRNVWMGTTVEDQPRADERIPLLLDIPAPVRFLSVEPQLGPVDIRKYMWPTHERWPSAYGTPEAARAAGAVVTRHRQALVLSGAPFVNWVIQGGESGGPHARPFDLAWAYSMRDQCAQAGVPYFFKQMGAQPFECDYSLMPYGRRGVPVTGAGSDQSEMPADLRIQQVPEVSRG